VNVHAVIVNWNGIEETLQCLENLKGQEPDLVLHVVDNGSEDGSKRALSDLKGSIQLHALKENVGFAAGANVGVEAAMSQGADLVFLMNNDARCEPNALGALISAASRHPQAGLFGGRIYASVTQDRLWACGVSMGWTPNIGRLRGHGRAGAGRYFKEEEVDSLTGCGLLVRREVFEAIGLFDESYFVYVEDADFCARARQAGFRAVYVPSAVLEHEGGGSTGKGYGPARKYLTAYFSVQFLRMHKTPKLIASFVIFDVLLFPITLLLALLRGRLRGALAKGRGTLHGLLRKPFDRSVIRPRVEVRVDRTSQQSSR
jgi:GT2 family glycosyltransferase